MERPKLVACDSMNYWIESKKPQLLEVLKRVDTLLLNDSELRGTLGRLERAPGRSLGPRSRAPSRGGKARGIRRAADRAGKTFFVPAFPLEEVFDPTGAGDSFAGGFLGYLARTGDLSSEGLRRAMVCGAVMGSYAVAKFSISGFDGVTPASACNSGSPSSMS